MIRKGRFWTCIMLAAILAGPAMAQSLRESDDSPASVTGFGATVAVGDDEVFAGEPMNSSKPGAVYLYRRNGEGAWAESGTLTASDAVAGDRFGSAIAVDGDRLIVGATKQHEGMGAAYVFHRDAEGEWTEEAVLTADDGAEGDGFGTAVALSDGVALVGAPTQNDNTGAVYVYRTDDAGAWIPGAKLAGSELAIGDRFGSSIALEGDAALVGAPRRNENAGVVYAFHREDGVWSEQAQLSGKGTEGDVRFGSALVLREGHAVVGAPRNNRFIGAAFEFVFDEEIKEWQQVSMLVPFDATPQTRFGRSVDMDDGEIWVGAPGAGRFSGAIYIFRRNAHGVWQSASKLAAGDLQSGDFFAGTMSVRGNLAVAGVPGADGREGTAVIFEHQSDSWTEAAVVYTEATGPASITGALVKCDEGVAGSFGCSNVDMISFLALKDIGGSRGVHMNDIWGWTDPETGKEYVLAGRTDGTAFVDISDPFRPVYLGDLPLHEGAHPAAWRDIKVYKDHAYVVSDGAGPHGMQVFDLRQLRHVENAPVHFEETAHYDKINSAHNIVIDEETGFAFAVGSSMGGETCGGGLHMINIQDPVHPIFAGCFSHTGTGRQGTGYTHDAQCVVYHGPDTEHHGQEICFGANETALSIADVSDKANPKALAQAAYPNVGYSHQGWLTEDQHYFFLDDELDEVQNKVEGTRTLIWDVSDLDDPQLVKEYYSGNKSTDHNLYIKGNLMYQSNYVSGLRIFDITDVENPVPVGYFDTVTATEDEPGFDGSWSNYPYFKSGVIAITSIREGLVLLKKHDVDI